MQQIAVCFLSRAITVASKLYASENCPLLSRRKAGFLPCKLENLCVLPNVSGIGSFHPTFDPGIELIACIIVGTRLRWLLHFVSFKSFYPVLIDQSIGAAFCEVY